MTGSSLMHCKVRRTHTGECGNIKKPELVDEVVADCTILSMEKKNPPQHPVN